MVFFQKFPTQIARSTMHMYTHTVTIHTLKLVLALALFITPFSVGCVTPWFKKEPLSEVEKQGKAVKEVLESENRPRIVGDAAVMLWTDMREYEGFGLVQELSGTGGDVKPSPQRELMLKEMRANSVDKPNEILASSATALVRIKAYCAPGSNKGDAIDVICDMSEECEGTSLRNGWLMPARLSEIHVLGGALRTGDLKARATGPLVILPPSVTRDPEANLRRGIVLGGAKLIENRRFSLRLRDTVRHVTTSAAISRAINDRYFYQDGSQRRGIASSKNDSLIHLELPEKHRWDIQHFTDLILAMGFLETPELTQERIRSCVTRMSEPTAARQACLELEAIGLEAIPSLSQNLNHPNPELRFYAAYSLAYLDHPPAAEALAELAIAHEEFRPLCLVGLQITQPFIGREKLEQLLQSDIPELRYGAYLSLRKRDRFEAYLQGEKIGDLLRFVSIPSDKPLVAVSLEERPEIVVFGDNPIVRLNGYYEVNPRLTMRSDANGQIHIVRYQIDDEDLTAVSSPDLLSVLQAFKQVGATYNDIVWWLDEATRQTWLSSPVVLDPRPRAGRVYHRDAAKAAKDSLATSINDMEQHPDTIPPKKRWWKR